jgi:hypothetical protein
MATKRLTIMDVSRLGNSRNGNPPQYRVIFTDGQSFNTRADSDFNYELENRVFRQGSEVVVDIDGRGQIAGISR